MVFAAVRSDYFTTKSTKNTKISLFEESFLKLIPHIFRGQSKNSSDLSVHGARSDFFTTKSTKNSR
jgi:hypothetical protein